MSLGEVIAELVETEGAIRLERGLGLRYTSMGPDSGIFSLSRQGRMPPSDAEMGIVLMKMVDHLPPHRATLNDGIQNKGGHKIRRITVEWDNEEE